MRVAYVAGPYGAPTFYEISENIRRARGIAICLWRWGWAVICPHANTSGFDGAVFPDDPEADRQVWLMGDLEIISRLNPESDCLVVAPGWERSSGTRGEIAEAINGGVPVYYWEEDQARLRDMARQYIVLDVPDGPDD